MANDDSTLVDELARLAHLELPAAEAHVLGAQLETILGYIRRLQSVDVTDVPEYLTAVQVRSGLRDDVEASTLDVDRALAAVPAVHDRLVAVPKFKD
ncbi:Asp-tRNA(Asn)/Glu-tRNA(Gln) amidotransferase subunit GatC [Enhygromyxa salina]|uniref:Aspartyl/glutamyl-tRNA(Asn/Gln) amidotransferase subunit C n=1 Tax=Enhygromyxa salina TaxID=215803 RepID=A0A2S9YX04_9BACT|nr:Asp-tRNA(Asn)/Glu-tRNA(Gln) amidotransferase subunit GatC [Enhygromyxa salina]PRQ09631.1 Glutamyl-tRNA(Gln) amidotransferase subunit C [Enhygromyxa salina]